MKSEQQKDDTYSLSKGNSVRFDFYYKKSERIVSALYLITQHIAHDEPLRIRIRQNALEMLSIVTGLKDTDGPLIRQRASELASHARAISTLLDVAEHSGLITSVNCEVCRSELDALARSVAGESSLLSSGTDEGLYSLLQEGKEADDDNRTERSATPQREKSAANAVDDRKSAGGSMPPTSGYASVSGGEKERSAPAVAGAQPAAAGGGRGTDSDSAGSKAPAAASPKPAVQAKKSQRQKAILRLIKEKGEISVKDAARVVHNCSEKTLQRELQALVREGVLQKEGKRRWTRYSFA